jgi:hypothetical protein
MFLNLNSRPFRAPRRCAFRPVLERLENRDTPSTTLLTVSPNPATVGQTVTLTATVTESGGDSLQPGTGVPPGTVTFKDGSATLMTVTVSPTGGMSSQGVAQLTTSALGAGAHSLTAHYSGEANPPVVASASPSNAVVETINPPAPPAPATPADVTPLVSVVVRRGLPRGQQLVTVTNTSGQAITGPLYLVFTRLPRRVRLKGSSGATQAHAPGSPFLLDAVTLLPGGFVNFLASFSGHKAGPIATEVVAGPGSP